MHQRVPAVRSESLPLAQLHNKAGNIEHIDGQRFFHKVLQALAIEGGWCSGKNIVHEKATSKFDVRCPRKFSCDNTV